MPSNSVLEWSNNNFLAYIQKLSVNTTLDFMLASINGFPKTSQKQRFIYAGIGTYAKSGTQNGGERNISCSASLDISGFELETKHIPAVF